MSDDRRFDQPIGPAMADRTQADALVRDHRARGSVKISRRRSPVRVALLVGAGLLAAAAAYYLFNLVQVVHTGGSHGADDADAIVVMGAAQYDGRPSPLLAARLDHAAELWSEGVAPTVVVTGGNRPGDRFTEAEASAQYLADAGVPPSAIVEVPEGSNTYDSVAAAAAVMQASGVDSVVVVTDPFHALRSRLIAEEFGFDVDVASTPNGVVTGWQSFQRSAKEAAGVSIGRIIGFERLTELTG